MHLVYLNISGKIWLLPRNFYFQNRWKGLYILFPKISYTLRDPPCPLAQELMKLFEGF